MESHEDIKVVLRQIKETPAWCNDCGWNGKRGNLTWDTWKGYLCPECESKNIEVTKFYLVTDDTISSIKFMAQLYWERIGIGPTYDAVRNWLESIGRF